MRSLLPARTHQLQVVILAAGLGSRLGRTLPKPLTELADGRSILRQQIDNVRQVFGPWAEISAVVGHKAELIVEAAPDVSPVYNDEYDTTNTSKSLLRALMAVPVGDVLWMNGDVVFDPEVLVRAIPLIAAHRSFVTVDKSVCGDEEVKYTLDSEGRVLALSKTVSHGLGEAVGINFVSAADRIALVRRLKAVAPQDYFELAVEHTIQRDHTTWRPLDITDLYAVEVDVEADLVRADRATIKK